MVTDQGGAVFQAQHKEKYVCLECRGIISIHDAGCSECQYELRN